MGKAPGRLRFRPRPVAALFTALALPLLIGLGIWQLDRLQWKGELIARVEQRVQGEPQKLPAAITTPDRWDYRPVRLRGRFDHAHEFRLQSRTRDGQVGIHLVTPLIRAEGPPVLVDRGWVPWGPDAPENLEIARPEGTVTLVGLARTPPAAGPFTPAPEPRANRWYRIDPQRMAEVAGLDGVAPVFVEAAPSGPGTLPIGGQSRVEFRNQHLNYALTWFFFALALLTIFILSSLRREVPSAAR